ncbi:type II secretion system F family protein [Paraburkholderia caballeronis]|uniref:Flp pilus assembly protein TadB n=1 Tax=Paraburkholderia caballeronis TaxID=416943 RepID=A0A1H7RRB8_9BURK|nr:type II secretion system F family protein [Paraburkholderia caballeronis]PXW23174.1 Flp pilus assembly protein TadB [Paraburkholderia caballeronis]PXW97838.1 Flp pilus assembly protein TadB [Paraburkholderia caballeronis]RAJ94808.1 Flp pilus assembly protein TadB [Paraburkholderia caballeronis]TDV11681.1 Flp pilus assembly protein TadB [Paraburkholderia caballeronis]TDV14762.1 Flp pilus assembly protein TadB [Paraburkholderia caballeronis]
MSLVDLATAAGFVCVLILGAMLMVWQDLRSERPEALIRARMAAAFRSEKEGVAALDAVQASTGGGWLGALAERPDLLGAKLARLRTVAPRGATVVGAGAVAALLVALAVPRFVSLPGSVQLLMAIVLPAIAVVRLYRMLVERFRQGFLASLPDAIDMIVRAVRAGIPVMQVIPVAAEECPPPLGREFKRMGDALQVGMDLEEVLNAAMKRVQIADFSFFCVCLLLQRETGGQLGETLENLAGIVRSRREIRQKTRALTAESRITVKILAAVPVFIGGFLYVSNRAYIEVLFYTQTGNYVLMASVISIIVGIVIINKIGNLDTSR